MIRLVSILFFAGLQAAEAPVGSLVCVAPVEFNGVRVYGAGFYFWPVLPHDEIATTASTGTIVFNDKSRVVLDRGTRIKLESVSGDLTITLLDGQLGYTLPPGAGVRIRAGNREVGRAGSSGIVFVRGDKVRTVEGRSKFAIVSPDPPPKGLPSLGAHLP